MKTVQISAVKRIATDEVNLVVLVLANGKPDVVRSTKEFLNDLKGSFLIDDSINSMNHPQVRKALRNLKGGMLQGDLKYAKAGDTWIVTENSQVVKNPKAKGFGQYAIGDAKEYEKDATIVVDGFLTFDFQEEAYQREENAEAYAAKRVKATDAFDIAPDAAPAKADDAASTDEGLEEDSTPVAKGQPVPAATAEEAAEATKE